MLDRDEVYHRGSQVRQLLVPLAKAPGGPAWEIRAPAGAVVIGTHDGSPPVSRYQDWRFSTRARSLRAMYYEVWAPTGEGARHFLTKACLSVYRFERLERETEILALHCDPEDQPHPDHPRLVNYKKAPHLHVMAAEEPIPKAHLGLVAGSIDDVLATASSLTEGLARSIAMKGHEVLDRYPT